MKWQGIQKVHDNILSLYYYIHLRHPKHRGWLPLEEEKVFESLSQFGIQAQDLNIDVDEYKDYFNKAGYVTLYPRYYPWNITEKSLEHFLAQKLLQLKPTDVYIDIASEGSPVPEIYHRLYGCMTYAQDLSYEPGLHGNKIGSDAAHLPLKNSSVTKMALHCSFEHFEGNSDSGFIRETARVLCVGGKVVIVPLYLSSRYAIATDPFILRASRIRFDRDAVVMAVEGWSNRHGKFYDPSHLSSRVLKASKDLIFSLICLRNPKDVNKSIYVRFMLVGTRIEFPAH